MSSTYGDKIKISVFGESHGNGIGVVIDGLPAGFEVDFDRVLTQMARRAPGKDKTATPRKEKDLPKVLSGMLGNKLTAVRFLNQRALKLLPISAVSAMFPTAPSVRRKLMTH